MDIKTCQQTILDLVLVPKNSAPGIFSLMTFKKNKRVGLLAFSVKRMIIIIYTICVLK